MFDTVFADEIFVVRFTGEDDYFVLIFIIAKFVPKFSEDCLRPCFSLGNRFADEGFVIVWNLCVGVYYAVFCRQDEYPIRVQSLGVCPSLMKQGAVIQQTRLD